MSPAEAPFLAPVTTENRTTLRASSKNGAAAKTARADCGLRFQATKMTLPVVSGGLAGATKTGGPVRNRAASMMSWGARAGLCLLRPTMIRS